MTELRRCVPCGGSGRLLGGGMIQTDCEECDGRGKIKFIKNDLEFLELKQTESYNKAIQEIKSLDTQLSDDDAKKLFEEELNKIESKEKKKRKERS